MDLYVLDENLNAVALIDSYNSLIWTDRYQECGDFELEMSVDLDLLDYIKQDRYLWRQDSEHVMIIETLVFTTDEEAGKLVTIKGRSLESILDRRIVWGLKNVTGNLQEEIEEIFNENIINPSKPERKIDNFIFEYSTDPTITDYTIDTQYTGDNIYDLVVDICVEGGFGFKVTLNESKQFVFQFYAGTDRSYDQFQNPCVIFSPDFENIVDGEYTADRSTYKNVTLIGGEGEGAERQYTAVGNVGGLTRRELFTDARDLSSSITEDITEQFDFTMYTGQVYTTSGSKASNSNFNSCRIDVSDYIGRTISVSVPKYKYKSDSTSQPDESTDYYYASVFLDSSGDVVSTAVNWEPYSDGDLTENRGGLETYDIYIPDGVTYFYTSMYSATAISKGIYSGETTDFEAQYSELSYDEYITLLRQRGREKLSENPDLTSFEGQAEPEVMFRYGVDFFMGDVVQIADDYGHETKAVITELITSIDESGFTTYPTFATVVEAETDFVPSGYTVMNYIQSTGTQYVNTDYKPTQDTRVVMELQTTQTADTHRCIFGTRASNSAKDSRSFIVWLMSSGTARSDYFGDNKEADFTVPEGTFQIDKNQNVCTISTITLTNNTATGRATYPLYLLACNNAGAMTHNLSTTKLYSCQIYENNTLVRKFVPVQADNGGVGLYDTVGQAFYGNSGTGTFTAG